MEVPRAESCPFQSLALPQKMVQEDKNAPVNVTCSCPITANDGARLTANQASGRKGEKSSDSPHPADRANDVSGQQSVFEFAAS